MKGQYSFANMQVKTRVVISSLAGSSLASLGSQLLA